GVVDDDVDTAKALGRGVDRLLDLAPVVQVASERKVIATLGFRRCDETVERALVDIKARDPVALTGEHRGERSPDVASRTGDENHLALRHDFPLPCSAPVWPSLSMMSHVAGTSPEGVATGAPPGD